MQTWRPQPGGCCTSSHLHERRGGGAKPSYKSRTLAMHCRSRPGMITAQLNCDSRPSFDVGRFAPSCPPTHAHWEESLCGTQKCRPILKLQTYYYYIVKTNRGWKWLSRRLGIFQTRDPDLRCGAAKSTSIFLTAVHTGYMHLHATNVHSRKSFSVDPVTQVKICIFDVSIGAVGWESSPSGTPGPGYCGRSPEFPHANEGRILGDL